MTLGAGHSGPLDQGALARALLAYAPAEVFDEVVGGATGLPLTPADIRQLRDDLREIAADGIARSAGEFISGSVAIAVPIIRDDGIVGAIGVIGPESRLRARVARAGRSRRPRSRARDRRGALGPATRLIAACDFRMPGLVHPVI